ncbi:MAG: XkdX family protein [Lachnospiraceae bacterium]|nr:XkdX family protein [Lachnospiraceae bacterium]
METWYNRLSRLYKEGRASKTMLRNAVKRGWITEEDYENIAGERYAS